MRWTVYVRVPAADPATASMIPRPTDVREGESTAEIEVYTWAAHGWCQPDSGVYNEPQAEKAWSRLLTLYGKALA